MKNQVLFKELFEKYSSGNCTTEEREEFFKQIRFHHDNSVMIDLMDNLYEEVKNEESLVKAEPKSIKIKQFIYKVTAAAVFIGIIAASLFYFFSYQNNYKLKLAGYSYKTKKAQRNYILLPDSTQIWMSASTDIRYPKKFAKDKREIYLEGEAYLDVKHTKDIPFIIHMPNDIAVTVLGTAFNIKSFVDREQMIVSVKRGKVRISKGTQVLSTLTVGQELRIKLETNAVTVKKIDTVQINNWQNGNVYFNDIAIKDLIKDISEQKNVKITIDNEKLANMVISVGFKKDESIKGVLEVIKAISDCQILEENGAFRLF